MDQAGLKASLIILVSVIGGPLGGIITDKLRKKNLKARMLVPAYSALISSLLLFVVFFLLEGQLRYAIFLLCGITASMYGPGGNSVTQDVVHPGIRAISFGINSVLLLVAGGVLSPIVIGALSDKYGLLAALRVLPGFLLFGGVAFLIGSFYYKRDLNRVDTVALQEQDG
jgi:MFS family permease